MKTVHVTAFAYDVLDRLIAESGFDHKLTGYRYNEGRLKAYLMATGMSSAAMPFWRFS